MGFARSGRQVQAAPVTIPRPAYICGGVYKEAQVSDKYPYSKTPLPAEQTGVMVSPVGLVREGSGRIVGEGRARTRAADLSAYRRDGQARASYESSPVAVLNPSLCFLHGCSRSS
jgi:hypothetical protein